MIEQQSSALIPTPHGIFNMIAYADGETEAMPHLAMAHPDLDPSRPVLVRIHSECMTGDLFGSRRCDCGEQLDMALSLAADQKGLVVYLRQEGRGIGLINKLKAYRLQDKGLNTIEANVHLGLEIDARQYEVAIQILKDLGITTIDLLTNNPEKIQAIENSDILIRHRLPLIIPAGKENYQYLKTKELQMGHLLSSK